MAVVDTIERIDQGKALPLRPGPHWHSFEQFRSDGSKALQMRVGAEDIGRLSVKDAEFVIMRAETFNKLYGQAQDVGRLARALRLVRQAVQLVIHTEGSRTALEHLDDLTQSLPGGESDEPRRRIDLVFEQDELADAGDAEKVEIDPACIPRPVLTRPR